jgi:tRNA-splicing ligase RtcB
MRVVTTEKKPIKMWLEDIEDGAMDQAKNLANLPFIHKHVALMPDAHQGFGMPIGGVIATNRVVIPNAVGVDIGCFCGDTRVPLLDGSQKTLKELADSGEQIWVYSLDEKLNVVPGKAVPKKTRNNADLMKVVVSGGEEVRCTPDHRFMLLDGTYKRADELRPMDSLMPLYRSYQSREGYEHVRAKRGTSQVTHKMVAASIYGNIDGRDVHHINGKIWDNRPENLQLLTGEEYQVLHGKTTRGKRFRSKEFKEKRLAVLRRRGFYDSKFAQKKKDVATRNITKYMDENSNEWREKVKGNGKRGAKYLREFNKVNNSTIYTCECGRQVKGKGGFVRHTQHCGRNHKVLYTEKVSEREDVYCLTVDKYHNFALSAGVFVHNCGMIAVRTDLEDISPDDRRRIMAGIRKRIPVGFNHQEEPEPRGFLPDPSEVVSLIMCDSLRVSVVEEEYDSARKQIGTLGGGNHFIELQKGSDGFVWIMIHSGSRNIGKKVADCYNKVAMAYNELWCTSVPKEWQLAFLPLDCKEGGHYMAEMQYCVNFALANRKLMMDRVKEVVQVEIGDVLFEDAINVPHNYAVLEHHYGTNVIVHRKGATRARAGELGIIPGSQGTKSYIVKGKGCDESFHSCSHGAGRAMGRKQAQRELDLEVEKKRLDDLGVIHSIRTEKDLDEAAGAYKSIDVVMENQADLVDIEVELTPLAVVKG